MSRLVIRYFVLLLLAVSTHPTLAQTVTLPQMVQSAKNSPLFRAELTPAQLKSRGLETIQLQKGIQLNVKQYLNNSRLKNTVKIRPLFKRNIQLRFLKAKPSYTEKIIQLSDRLIINRTVKIKLKPGACGMKKKPAAISDLCFRRKAGRVHGKVAKKLKEIRQKLRSAPPKRIVVRNVTVAQARRLSDTDLLGLLLYSEEREIQHVSILPLRVRLAKMGKPSGRFKVGGLGNFARPLPQPNLSRPILTGKDRFGNPGKMAQKRKVRRQSSREIWNSLSELGAWEFGMCLIELQRFTQGQGQRGPEWGDDWDNILRRALAAGTLSVFAVREWDEARPLLLRIKRGQKNCTTRTQQRVADEQRQRREQRENRAYNFEKRYFLTGRTVIRNIGDTYQYTFTQETWLTDSYYVRFSYNLGYEFGLRFPYSLKVKADPLQVRGSGNSATRNRRVSVTVAPVNADRQGRPVYQAVGLDQNFYRKGREFTFSFGAGCSFKASIPGPNVNLSCPSINFDTGKDFTPSLGSTRRNIGNLWVLGRDLQPQKLGIHGWVGGAYLDLGVAADMTNGRIGYRITPDANSQLSQLQNRYVWADSERPRRFTLSPRNINLSLGFKVDQPKYKFRIELIPQARINLNLDLGVYELNRNVGPIRFDSLSIGSQFEVDRHPGTTSYYNYKL
ncbi:MAG: hypothetical protein GXP09_02870 [Gammaproteobacteria bacterium]|nr:hypothetical protein [Gammaproteobacteria bacterium]